MAAYASFEDILYIIVGIIWVAFSFYKAKKKKQSQKSSPPTSNKKSMIESLFDEIGGKEGNNDSIYNEPTREPFINDPIKETIAVEESEKLFSYDDFNKESNYNPTVAVFEEKRSPAIKDIADLNYSMKKYSGKKRGGKINLRQAVIYSEILNRPEF